MALYNQNMSNATTARAALTTYARDILARTVTSRYGSYTFGINLSTQASSDRTTGVLRELTGAGLVTAERVPCEDAEDPEFHLTATERGRKSYAKAKAAGLVS